MSKKDFKSYEEQLDILRKRGLRIDDDNKAIEFLKNNNYYRISGYSLTLRNHDIFYEQASFQNIIDIYNCDHEMRFLLLKYLEEIEVIFKSIYVYNFSRIYGPLGYLSSSHFNNPSEYISILSKTEDQKNKRLPNEAYLKHFINDLKEDIPFWAYVDLFTISDISKLYSISEDALKEAVANNFDIKGADKTQLLGSFMHSMTILRNLCAHGSRIYNRLFEQKPALNSRQKKLLLKKESGAPDNSHLFGFVLLMLQLLPEDSKGQLKQDLKLLSQKYLFVDFRHYGFSPNWEHVI